MKTPALLCALALLVGCTAEVRSTLDHEIQGGSPIATAPNVSDAEHEAGRLMPRPLATARGVIAEPTPLPLVLFVGNSLTKGDNASSPAMTYPAQTMGMTAATTWQNLGHNSETTPQMSAEAPTLVDSQFDANAPPVVVVWEGTNDLFLGATAADAFDHLATYCADRRAVGFRVVLLSVLPLSNGAVPDFETRRQQVNADLRLHFGEFADRFADVGAAAELQNPLDSTVYQADHVHLKDPGLTIVARLVAAQLR